MNIQVLTLHTDGTQEVQLMQAEECKNLVPRAERREEAYNTEAVIAWDGILLSVTEAAQKWQYYAAEGSEKAAALQALIAAAKAEIRARYADETEDGTCV